MRKAIAARSSRRRRRRRKPPAAPLCPPPVTILGVTYRPRRPQLPLTPPHMLTRLHGLAAIACHLIMASQL